MEPFEKLGAFYLGKVFDPARGEPAPELLLYDAKDLTTHAVCVGMTGSGKTGLCVALLEEAAIDGIPALAIDPKGDLGNLLLTFPSLRAADFLPWIDPAEAARKGRTTEQYADEIANVWKKGLSDWGEDGERIRRLESAVDRAIYTPGSQSGLPLRVLRSFAAPPPALREDGDALRERILASVSGLLGLLGIDADPIRSREHILLSNLLERAWREGRDLDIADLIREIQKPPFERIGVLDLESIFPEKHRFELAMSLNNLLASPGFAAWMEGEPLDVGRLFYTPEGRPRLSILSIAHLSESERMFFVTLLLTEVVAWMRSQPGTSSLRALLYMDEVFGFFPPSANPPSKTPMLTLLKQARAFGLGVVLATQNPVDLDYKGLSNAGTWFLGRLQTERDKARVIEGLEGASLTAGSRFDRAGLEARLAGLGSRVFLMNNVHEDHPVLFHTRWALSYLRGPLTRAQIRTLMSARAEATRSGNATPGASPVQDAGATRGAAPATMPPEAPGASAARPSSRRTSSAGAGADAGPSGASNDRPILPSGVPERFLRARAELASEGECVYRPALLGKARLHFVKASAKVEHWDSIALVSPFAGEIPANPWDESRPIPIDRLEIATEARPRARYLPLPGLAQRKASYASWEKALKSALYQTHTLDLHRCPDLKEVSRPGESEGDFRVRLRQGGRERRDLELEKLRDRYGKKLAQIRDRIDRAQEKVEREQSQYQQQSFQTAVSVGATFLGALFGRKLGSARTIGRATTAVRGAGRAARERSDIARAEENLAELQAKLQALEEEFNNAIRETEAALDPRELEIEDLSIRPRKADILVEEVALLWMPWHAAAGGTLEPAFPPD
jgi:DNA helicase HerA-like ATPase